MDRNALHHTIPIGHPTWFWMNLGLILATALLCIASHKKSERRKNLIAGILAWIVGLNFIAEQVEALYHGTWHIETYLPLHLCSLSTFLAIAFLRYRNPWVYEFLIFWSAGAIHAFITPEITSGDSLFHVVCFSISHGGIIVTSIFASTQLGFTPRTFSWLKVFGYTQLVLPVIGIINYLLHSNYMYIAQKPNANNPMIIGEWPWYIIGLEFVVLIHFYVFYHIHKFISKPTAIPSLPD
jgi:hypothetical integral membrane protein (TIGR02206 family)